MTLDSEGSPELGSPIPTAGASAPTKHERFNQWLDALSDSLDAASPRARLSRPEFDELDIDDADGKEPFPTRAAEEWPRSPAEPALSPVVESPPLDMAEQQRLIKLHRQDASRRWVERNAPPSFTTAEQKHLLHILLFEANRYHHSRGSTGLNRKVADCVADKQKGAPIPPNLQVDPNATKLTDSVLNQLCFDLDWIVDNCRHGPHVALQSLEEMRLWRMQPEEQ